MWPNGGGSSCQSSRSTINECGPAAIQSRWGNTLLPYLVLKHGRRDMACPRSCDWPPGRQEEAPPDAWLCFNLSSPSRTLMITLAQPVHECSPAPHTANSSPGVTWRRRYADSPSRKVRWRAAVAGPFAHFGRAICLTKRAIEGSLTGKARIDGRVGRRSSAHVHRPNNVGRRCDGHLGLRGLGDSICNLAREDGAGRGMLAK
jgi:hypothetical protein